MTIIMNDVNATTLSQLEQFLAGTISVAFRPTSVGETYAFVSKTLTTFSYRQCSRYERGVIRAYLGKLTGYSPSQLTRLIHSSIHTGRVVRKRYHRHVFPRKYSGTEISLLAKTDSLHDTPNGKTIKRILQREWEKYQKPGFESLSTISVSHIYNLRTKPLYRRINVHFSKTRPVKSSIGERRTPRPNGSPGYLRVDSVHQGDLEHEKGVYHINIVDEVT